MLAVMSVEDAMMGLWLLGVDKVFFSQSFIIQQIQLTCCCSTICLSTYSVSEQLHNFVCDCVGLQAAPHI